MSEKERIAPKFYFLDNQGKMMDPTGKEKDIRIIDNDIRLLREKLLSLPSKEKGMNMDRVYDYCRRAGFSISTAHPIVRVLAPEDFAKALVIHGKRKDDKAYGNFSPQLFSVIVKRDPDLEKLNGGPIFTEGLVTHELAHAQGIHSVICRVRERFFGIRRKNYADIGRSGFLTMKEYTKSGGLLEEGYAELERGRYIREHSENIRTYAHRGMISDENVYTSINKHGRPVPNFLDGAYIAALFELCSEHDPSFLPVLRLSRRSVSALREMPRRLDAIYPGLYRTLRQITNEPREVPEIYDKIKATLEERRANP